MKLESLYESLTSSSMDELSNLVKNHPAFNKTKIKMQIRSAQLGVDIIDAFEQIVSGSEVEFRKWINHIKSTNSINRFIDFVIDNSSTMAYGNKATQFDPNSIRKLIMVDGSVPKYVYRVVSEEDYNRDRDFLLPSEFYKRIHASATPDKNYGKRGDLILQIQYSEQDKWHPKMASLYGRTEIYAVTYEKIQKRKIKIIGRV